LVLTPAFSLLPILVVRYFGGDAIQLSGLESAWGVGVVLGGLLLSVWGGFRRQILTTLVGLLGMGLSTLVVGLAPASSFFLALGGMFAVGLMMPIVNGPIIALVQGVVAPEVQGRVFTLLSSAAQAASPLGLIIAGPVADTLGVRVWFILGGIVTMLMSLVGFFTPAMMRIEERPLSASEDKNAVSSVPAGQGARAEV
jgi:DHA3 family macrolide efflux protein-like MFS transporter